MDIGIYLLRDSLIVSSMAVVYSRFFLMIALFFLLSSNVLISSMLSRIMPVLSDNKVKILSCASFKDFLPEEMEITTSSRCF